MQTDIQLRIRNYFKGIPYGPVDRGDGHPNHGFKSLKGKPEEAALIAEVRDNKVLRAALVRINARDTPFFTIGCEKKFNHEHGVFWARGFLEFAFNYPELAADAQNYFKQFYDFNFHLFDEKFDEPVQFSWELEGAAFRESGTNGFSACIWITTKDLSDEAETRRVWEKAVRFLTDYLAQQRALPLRMIYPCNSNK